MNIEIWTAATVARHIDAPEVTLLDVRRGERFASGHIPGARHFSVYGINTYDTDDAPLDSFVKMWAFQLSLAGIDRDSLVIVYGDTSDESAARAGWFLDWLGHSRCAVLDGGISAWQAAGGALEHSASAPRSTPYAVERVDDRVATWRDMVAAIDADDAIILDTRSDDEWFGRDARGTPRAGAIPSAIHLEWKAHLDEHGQFLSAQRLRDIFEQQGITPEHRVLAYCNTGYRSAHAYLALGRAGYSRLSNYVGSWQEWAHRPECPVVVPEPGSRVAPPRT